MVARTYMCSRSFFSFVNPVCSEFEPLGDKESWLSVMIGVDTADWEFGELGNEGSWLSVMVGVTFPL